MAAYQAEAATGDRVSSDINLVFPSGAAKDALKAQRRRPGRRRQPPYCVSIVVEKPFDLHGGRKFELRLLSDTTPKIGVDVHHGEDCRWLRKIERNIKAVANLHMNFPKREPARQSAVPLKRR